MQGRLRPRAVGIVIGIGLGALSAPGVARADAAGPTDYQTTIESVAPQIDGLEVSIVGGDAFVRLRAPVGSEVIVLGYAGEPYLRFTASGAVSENRLSAATYENAERFGIEEIPPFVDNEAAPEWRQIATTGVWSWHDHRSHWMGREPLIGLEPGDSLPPQVIPLIIDGRSVSITVMTTLLEQPAPWPAMFGALIGGLLALLAIRLGPANVVLLVGSGSAVALLVGAAQYLSLPSETQPLLTWWLLPALAGASVVVTIATYGRSVLLRHGLVALAAGQLLIWSLSRRDAFTRAVLPTDLPFPLDRGLTAAVLVGSVFALGATLWSLAQIVVDPRRVASTT